MSNETGDSPGVKDKLANKILKSITGQKPSVKNFLSRKAVEALQRLYWKIFRSKTLGVRLILINNNKVLLVNHSYIKGLFLPGGGVNNGEIFSNAIKRELLEELGFELKNLSLFGVYQSSKEGKIDTIITFISTDNLDLSRLKLSREIRGVDFYDINNLPPIISPGSKRRIEEYQTKCFPIAKEW